ncbi:hypothetical protein [Pseudochrobactrum saccharolyticum]|uniref:hypothetical protein n=1 Tax=Pseudochrobactrum saccharolyticum TaxID=354352 RepID=UPI00275E9D6F|nr:hypothetical protein [Pseudochrobactrum saccharolyticum]MDP8250505.1 hypothetical protein [Pseudochrobactrum saccharolyticum]
MANPNITFIPRGDSALSGFGILAAVILTTDANDANEYSVAFGKDPSSTSRRNVKTDKVLFKNKTASGANYTQEASTYIFSINDNTGEKLIISAQLYKDDQKEGSPITLPITFYNLGIQNPASIVSAKKFNANTVIATEEHFQSVDYNQIMVNIHDYITDLPAQVTIGFDVNFSPLPDNIISAWSSPGSAGTTPNLPVTPASPVTILENYVTVLLTKAAYATNLYITSTEAVVTQAQASIPIVPPLTFIDIDQQYVMYMAPQPVNLNGNTVTVPAGQTYVYFNIDPDAITPSGDKRVFWMVLNGEKVVLDPIDISQVSTTISVPVAKLNTVDSQGNPLPNRLQYFIESVETGAVRSSEYGWPFEINSQFQNEPNPGITNRPYAAPVLFPTPNGGAPNLIDETYVTTNKGASGDFPTGGNTADQYTINVFINGWDSQGNPKNNTLHPQPILSTSGQTCDYTIDPQDLLGYSVQPHTYAFSTMQIEYYISDPTNINFGKYSRVISYKIDTVSP